MIPFNILHEPVIRQLHWQACQQQEKYHSGAVKHHPKCESDYLQEPIPRDKQTHNPIDELSDRRHSKVIRNGDELESDKWRTE